jgi:uncharacterized repeat protein (TIGR01451 family)
MTKNIIDPVRETVLARHWIRGARVRSLLSLMFSAMLVMSNATPFVQVASAAAGDFSIDFIAAAPESYNHLTGGGAYDNRTIGVGKDVVESLQGGDFSCGDIVTFFALVTVDDTSQADNDEPQTIEMNFSFTADTTGQSGAAFGDIVSVGVNYGTIEDLTPGENTIDDGIIDDGGSVATLTNEILIGPLFQKGSELHGTVELTDLEAGEQVVVRIDVKLFCNPGSRPTGNLQAAIEDAHLTSIKGSVPATRDISVGRQTIPLKQINNLHNPDLKIQKTVNTTDGICPGVETLTVTTGNTVKYCYIVSNPGDAPLYNVNVIDDAGTPSGTADDFTVTLSTGLTDVDGDGDADDLAEGGTAMGTALVTLSTAGKIINNATATGNNSIIQPTTLTASDIATVIVEGVPSYTIDKTVVRVDRDGDGTINNAGEIIEYQIIVNNTGSIDLTNVTVTDPLLGTLKGQAGDNVPAGILNVGESWIFTGNYTVTQADINNNGGGDGDIDNTATVECDQLEPQEDSEEVPIAQNAAYTIDKIVTDIGGEGALSSVGKAGDVISYKINVTNTGNVDLTNVTVMDSLIENLNGPVESLNTDRILEVGETWKYTGTYTVTMEDIITNGGGDGFIENTATVDSDQLGPESDNADAPIKIIPVCEPNPAYEIEKSITDVDCRGPTASVKEAGDIITYSIVVANTGDVDLTKVAVTDSLIDLEGPVESKNKDSVLEVGETWTYTGMYTVTQQDIDTDGECDGYIDNVATVDCDQLGPKSDSVRVIIEKASKEDSTEEDRVEKKQDYCIYKSIIGIDESGDRVINEAGDIIEYQIIVKNEGNTNLTGVSVRDPMITLAGPIGDNIDPGVLNPGETWKFFGNYTVTQEDINSNGGGDGFIENKATVSCNELPEESSSVKQLINISSDKGDNASDENKENNGDNGDDGSGGDNEIDEDTESDGDTGKARVIPKNSTRAGEVSGNKERQTDSKIELEPDIKSFEQNTGNVEAAVEKEPEQKENTGIPGLLIYGIIGLLAILLLVHLYKRK